jgi:hypothetical protein
MTVCSRLRLGGTANPEGVRRRRFSDAILVSCIMNIDVVIINHFSTMKSYAAYEESRSPLLTYTGGCFQWLHLSEGGETSSPG